MSLNNSHTKRLMAVYDGTFSRRLVPGRGVTAAALAAAGLEVGSEEDAAAAGPATGAEGR